MAVSTKTQSTLQATITPIAVGKRPRRGGSAKAKDPSQNGASNQLAATKKRTRHVAPFPAYPLDQALALAQAIADNNACKPYSRLSLAEAVGRSPEASQYRQLITSAASYGITEGSYQATQIALTDLGMSIVAPRTAGERQQGIRTAAMNIDVFRRLYEHFDQHKLPSDDLFRNTLIRDFNVDAAIADRCIAQFKADGRYVGLIRTVAGAERVDLLTSGQVPASTEALNFEQLSEVEEEPAGMLTPATHELAPGQAAPAANQRVFVTHGKNRDIVGQLKELLTFGKFIPVVAVEHETTSIAVPDKVLDDMRSCFAGVIHVESEETLLDSKGQEHHRINENVLIEIGAAMALFGRNFVLLVQKGLHLPSNLQGLYRCEYDGQRLDYEATMKLLKTFNDFK